METNHWVATKRRAGNGGGRSSKVKEVLGMDLAGYLEGVPDKFSLNHGARALREWLGKMGMKISVSTGKRIVTGLVLRGTIEKHGLDRSGYDWELRIKR